MYVETPLKIACERGQLLRLIWKGIACSDMKGTNDDQNRWERGKKKGKKKNKLITFL